MTVVARSGWGYLPIWELRLRPGGEKAFEPMSGAKGDWASLFPQYAS